MNIYLKKKINYILLFSTTVFLFSCAPKVVSPERQLANELTSSVLWFQQSAEMVAAYLQAYNYAGMLVAGKLDTLTSGLPPAVVLDIDETVLDNSPYEAELIREGKLYDSDSWKRWTDKVRAEALPGAIEFINGIKTQGVEVFYISNRKEHALESTIQNLQILNFPNADKNHVLLRTDSSDKSARRTLVARDYTIILFVGDNLTDFSEMYANRDNSYGKNLVLKHQRDLLNDFVILPNPMYGDWERAIYGNNDSIPNEMKIKMRQQALKK